MVNWLRKTVADLGNMAKDTANIPAPIGKTVATVLVVEGIVVVTFLLTHKVKVITVLG